MENQNVDESNFFLLKTKESRKDFFVLRGNATRASQAALTYYRIFIGGEKRGNNVCVRVGGKLLWPRGGRRRGRSPFHWYPRLIFQKCTIPREAIPHFHERLPWFGRDSALSLPSHRVRLWRSWAFPSFRATKETRTLIPIRALSSSSGVVFSWFPSGLCAFQFRVPASTRKRPSALYFDILPIPAFLWSIIGRLIYNVVVLRRFTQTVLGYRKQTLVKRSRNWIELRRVVENHAIWRLFIRLFLSNGNIVICGLLNYELLFYNHQNILIFNCIEIEIKLFYFRLIPFCNLADNTFQWSLFILHPWKFYPVTQRTRTVVVIKY